jgi:hypothetical protein
MVASCSRDILNGNARQFRFLQKFGALELNYRHGEQNSSRDTVSILFGSMTVKGTRITQLITVNSAKLPELVRKP